MQQPDAEGGFTKHSAPEPLPPRWRELLAKLDTVCGTEAAPSPPTQPEQTADGADFSPTVAPDGARSVQLSLGTVLSEELASEVVPPSLMKLLAQLNERMKTDAELERCYGAVDRAVAELVRHRPGGPGAE